MDAPLPTLEHGVLVGKGFCSDVYAWGEGRVLKLFHGVAGHERADREFAATRAVHAAGLPAPAAYERVEVDGRSGIVFERVNGVSLLEYTRARPWAVFSATRRLAELHARLHRCPAPDGLPTLRERIAARIDDADVPAADKQAARARLDTLPDGAAVCHGDFHPANVLVTPRGFVVFDWSAAARGDPLGDVACTSRLLRTAILPPWCPRYMHAMLRCLRPALHRAYLTRYFRLQPGTPAQIEAWQGPLAVAAQGVRID